MPKRTDANQKELVAAIRKLGVSVLILSDLGKGCPDIALGHRGINYFCECKTEKGKLTPAQELFFDQWRGQVSIIRSLDDVFELLNISP